MYYRGQRLLITVKGTPRPAVVIRGGDVPTIRFEDNRECGPIPEGATVASGGMFGAGGW